MIEEESKPQIPLTVEKIQKTKIFFIKDDKTQREMSLEIILQENSFLVLKLKEKEEMTTQYKSEIKLDNFKSQNNYFNEFNSLHEIFEKFIPLLDSKNLKIEKENETIKLLIEFLNSEKVPENINFFLNKEKIDINEVITDLCNKNKEIDSLKEKINKLEEENKNANNKILLLENKIIEMNENFEKKFLEILEKINKKEDKINSFILERRDINLIKIGITKKINKKLIDLKLIYRASDDGDSAQIFHSKCDQYVNTITVIRSENGRRFGGFTTKNWSLKGPTYEVNGYHWKEDRHAFLFSLDNNECYYVKRIDRAIGCDKNDLAKFGGGFDILIADHCRSCNKNYEYESLRDYDNNGKKGFLFTGSRNFVVSDLEVFQAIFE